jgi:hypothetical protein
MKPSAVRWLLLLTQPLVGCHSEPRPEEDAPERAGALLRASVEQFTSYQAAAEAVGYPLQTPSGLPRGFVLTRAFRSKPEIAPDGGFASMMFSGPKGAFVLYQGAASGGETFVPTGPALEAVEEAGRVDVGGTEATWTLAESDDGSSLSLSWQNADMAYLLESSTLSLDALVTIAGSLEPTAPPAAELDGHTLRSHICQWQYAGIHRFCLCNYECTHGSQCYHSYRERCYDPGYGWYYTGSVALEKTGLACYYNYCVTCGAGLAECQSSTYY